MLSVVIIILKGRSFRGSMGLFRGSMVLIWMSVLLILEVISASSSVYIHYVSLDTLDTQKERVGLICVTAYLYILSGMILFKALFHVYGRFTRRPHSNRTQQSVGHAIVYMLGAVGLSFVNSIALAVELILKARNGERTVEDLRVILIPSESVFAIGCLMLQISAFWWTNRERLMYDLKDLRQLCRCKQVSADSPVQNHELQALQNSRG
ncbi:uncharacterized protein LOC118809112 isoform X2 [Colossoma macropomum]|uniref:uncharacterized protein LOC118809112 isoform X2 n=1 Tax=Colossoma macropomum TaxID=42526 RepID=UPI0018651D07|nr:uncharacterized protein LOC118809112 isoform X2 [Colossoma macropomum]